MVFGEVDSEFEWGINFDRAAKLKVKEEPYIAENFGKVRLNGRVTVDGNQGVVCLHLALAFAEFPVKKRELMAAFSSKEGIEAHFDNKLEGFEAKFAELLLVTEPDCVHVLHEEQFGHYLAALAKAIPSPAEGEQSKADWAASTLKCNTAQPVRCCTNGNPLLARE